MKPTVTWVLLANGGMARIVTNLGPGKGFSDMKGKTWRAAAPVEYADKPGVERSSTNHGSVMLGTGDPKDAAETAFAVLLAEKLQMYCRSERFDRLIIAAGPSLLGKLRIALPEAVQAKTIAEVDKDLTHIPTKELAGHLQDVIAA